MYWFVADGVGPLLDPDAMDVVMTADGPRSVVRTGWPKQPSLGSAPPRSDRLRAARSRLRPRRSPAASSDLPYLADLGVNVIELMPVHPFDPSDNYWGYMPLVWGAVHRPYAAGDDAPGELARRWSPRPTQHDIEVWLDVVFNHTGERLTRPSRRCRCAASTMPTRTCTATDGTYNDDSGCGNVSNPADPDIQRLVLTALDRFADLGIDGFRFDLASLLTRDGGGLVDRITEWGAQRGVRLIAEPWDLAVVPGRPVAGAVAAVERPLPRRGPRLRPRRAGSGPRRDASACRAAPTSSRQAAMRSVNFVTAHDGLTMHDLTHRHRVTTTIRGTAARSLRHAAAEELLHDAAAVGGHARCS